LLLFSIARLAFKKEKVMKIGLHAQPLVAVLNAAIDSWRKSAGQMSREAVATEVVAAHERIGADVATGIRFDSSSADAFERAKVAAQKLFRWLDNVTRDATLPASMVQSVLAALPLALRVQAVNEILRPLELEAHQLQRADGCAFDALACASATVKESSEAAVALLTAGANPTPEALKAALKEVTEAEEAAANAKRALIARIEQGEVPAPLRAVG
jgi:hypothetical protein